MKKKTKEKIEKIVRDNYSEIANEFDKSRQKKLWPKLYEFKNLISNNQKILDIGCGNGRLINLFSNKKIDYLGVDQDNKLIELAKKNWPDYKFKLASLPNKLSGKYDLIFMIAVFHHIVGKDNRLKVLLNIKELMNENSFAIISVWNLRKIKKYLVFKTWFKSLFKEKIDYGDIFFDWNLKTKEKSLRYYHAFSKKELKKLVNKAGLKIEKIEADKHNIWLILKK